MTVIGSGPCYIAAVQAFCVNHGIVSITGKALSEMIGYSARRCSRVLNELGWDCGYKKDRDVTTWTRNGSHKHFRISYNFKLILSRFEEHYEKVRNNE